MPDMESCVVFTPVYLEIHHLDTYLEQNADTQVHEGFGEVYNTFSGVVDGHRTHSQVSFLRRDGERDREESVRK